MQTKNLSFGDGFQFGCGFFAAWLLSSIILGLLIAVLLFATAMFGLGNISPMLRPPGGMSLPVMIP